MEVTKGKLKNTKSGKELTFAINPTHFELSQSYDYSMEPQLAQPCPLVAFRCGGAAILKFGLNFDRDAGLPENGLSQVQSFLSDLNKIDESTASVPVVEFKMGATVFQGYVKQYRYRTTRFDPKGEAMGASLDLELVSNGNLEKGAS